MESPRVIVMCGLPGVGKSTVSGRIAENVGCKRLQSDAIRKELFDEPTYSGEESRRVYGELKARAETELQAGRSVVLDATFSIEYGRDSVAKLASRCGAEAVFVHVTCDEEVVERRLREREDDISDAGVEVYRRAKESFEPIERECVTIDTTADGVESVFAQVDRELVETNWTEC